MKKTKYIGTFKATDRSPNAYKTDAKYLDALWRKNKQKLEQAGLNKTQFTSRMKNILDEGLTRREATYSYSRTRLFLSKEEVGLQNIKENLRKSESIEIRKASGFYKKAINWSKYKWDENVKGYMYEDGSHYITWNYGEDSKSENYIGVTYVN